MNLRKTLDRYRFDGTGKFRLADHKPDDTGPFRSKDESLGLLEKDAKRLASLQEKLFAQDQWALLVIVQAMDAAGKDSTIKHVMSGINPQGCEVYSFKAPSAEELDHDFLWRTSRRVPERGRIGIFNRSYYEEVLIVRVHPELLAKEHLPRPLITKDIWKQRFEDIRGFERYLTRNGVAIRKFFLNVSRDAQRRRFLERLDEPEKNWKFSADDIQEREHWHDYMHAYEDMIRHTGTKEAPWHVVPADHKWFSRLVVAAAVVEALEELNPSFPKVDKAKRKELERIRREFEKQK